MDSLKQFDRAFNVAFTVEESKKMFVNSVESAIFDLFQGDKLCGSYYLFMKELCILLGLNIEEYLSEDWRYFVELKKVSQSDFIKTLRVLIVSYNICKSKSALYANDLEIIIIRLLEGLPTPIGIKWSNGSFYKDVMPELADELIDDNLEWLKEFPAARIDMQNALKNYTAENKDGVVENIYKAIETIAQKLTCLKIPLHDSKLQTTLYKLLNVSDSWRQFLVKFVQYTNDYGRHGTKEDRHNSDPDEIESFLFLGLIMLRMMLKKWRKILQELITRDSLIQYLMTSTLVERIENECISINPKLKNFDDLTQYNPVPELLISNMKRLNMNVISDVEELYLKYEKALIFSRHEQFRDYQDMNYVGKGSSLVALINLIEII